MTVGFFDARDNIKQKGKEDKLLEYSFFNSEILERSSISSPTPCKPEGSKNDNLIYSYLGRN